MVSRIVSGLKAEDAKRLRMMTAPKNFAAYYQQSLCFGFYGRQVCLKITIAFVAQLLKYRLALQVL